MATISLLSFHDFVSSGFSKYLLIQRQISDLISVSPPRPPDSYPRVGILPSPAHEQTHNEKRAQNENSNEANFEHIVLKHQGKIDSVCLLLCI